MKDKHERKIQKSYDGNGSEKIEILSTKTRLEIMKEHVDEMHSKISAFWLEWEFGNKEKSRE